MSLRSSRSKASCSADTSQFEKVSETDRRTWVHPALAKTTDGTPQAAASTGIMPKSSQLGNTAPLARLYAEANALWESCPTNSTFGVATR